MFLYDVDCRFYWYGCEECTDIIGHDALIWFDLDIFNTVQEVLVVLDMMGGPTYQGFEDLGQLFCCFIGG